MPVIVIALMTVCMAMIVLMPTFIPVMVMVGVGMGFMLIMVVTTFLPMPVMVSTVRMCMLVLLRAVHFALVTAEFKSLDRTFCFPVEMHVEIPDVELGQLPLECGGSDTEVRESPHHHVPADATETIQIKNLFHNVQLSCV